MRACSSLPCWLVVGGGDGEWEGCETVTDVAEVAVPGYRRFRRHCLLQPATTCPLLDVVEGRLLQIGSLLYVLPAPLVLSTCLRVMPLRQK